jgi:uncharacterized membrane protein (DUF4010 family)
VLYAVEPVDLLSRFALALGIGLLIGLERGWRTREHEAGSRAAGVRTFTISGLLGGVAGALGQTLGGIAAGVLLGLSFVAFAIVMAVFSIEENRADRQYSATTWVAAMLTFALGAYALIGDMRAAAALAVAAAVILAMREQIHGWVQRITWPELRSGLVLLAMTFVALPLLPDDPVGPYGGVNLREVWIIAIVLAVVSFAGYAAVKHFGARRGVLIAGLAGGLASSTAVTIANARRAAAGEGSTRLLAGGVSLASAVMFLRVCGIVLVINPSLIGRLAPPLVAAALAGLALGVWAGRSSGSEAGTVQPVDFRNPFSFVAVLGFALLLGLVILLGRVVAEYFGASGAIVGAAVIGLADVDSVTISTARLTPSPLSALEASVAILAAVATDTLSKAAIGAAIAPGRFAFEIVGMAAACLAAGGLAAWVTLSVMSM